MHCLKDHVFVRRVSNFILHQSNHKNTFLVLCKNTRKFLMVQKHVHTRTLKLYYCVCVFVPLKPF